MRSTGSSLVATLLDHVDPGRPALLAGDAVVTHRELRQRIDERTEQLDLAERSVVGLAGGRDLDLVLTHLALLDAGHVPILLGEHHDRILERWKPALVVTTGSHGLQLERHDVAPADLHPDLALLLSTSGSTGAPKLVRLSHRNLTANAAAIAGYLELGPEDRAVTSLPLHYCYGLSVLHSHLAAGAATVLTDTSVVDPCFARLVADHGVTNVAAVPHTFQLLDRAHPSWLDAPSLRFLTVAGGALAPEDRDRWRAELAARGVDLWVMYGQTEATARMAYLPPHLAERHPGAVGRAVPGGELSLRPVEGRTDGVGELVYRGPNVMLGYATDPVDLARGAELDELRTGDLGRWHAEDDVFEVVGRLSRFVKPFGLRIDLDWVQSLVGEDRPEAVVAGDDHGVVVAVPDPDHGSLHEVAGQLAAVTGLPRTAVAVVPLGAEGPPLTASGKVDHGAVLAAARTGSTASSPGPPSTEAAVLDRAMADHPVAVIYREVLGVRDVGPDTTFVTAGGDSLSYVECSVRLEAALGTLPPDWHLRPVRELERTAGPRRGARIDTTLALRAAGILAVVSTHMRIWYFPGGAHLLLAVAGYNLSRFQLALAPPSARTRAVVRSLGRVVVPTVVWVAAFLVLTDRFSLHTLTLTNSYLGPANHGHGRWQFWFVEALVALTVAVVALLAVPAIGRLDRRRPYVIPLVAFLAAAALVRADWAINDPLNLRFRAHGVAWFFLLGWLVQRSDTPARRLLTSALAVALVPGFFGQPWREAFVVGGVLALLWCRSIWVPRAAVLPIAAVSAASMAIYITHFQVWRPLDSVMPRGAAYVGTILAGIAAWELVTWVGSLSRSRPRPSAPRPRG